MSEFAPVASESGQKAQNYIKAIDFHLEKHIAYIKKVSSDTDSFEFVVSQHLRMSGVYWGLCAISLLGVDLDTEMNAAAIAEWVMKCQHESGG
jgi:geranylgeranyl transferase type-2 subunit beta